MNESVNRSIQSCIERISAILREDVADKVYPYFIWAKGQEPWHDGIASSENDRFIEGHCHVTLPPAVSTPQGNMVPVAFGNRILREKFFRMLGKITFALREKFPLTNDFATNAPHVHGSLICGSDTNLSIDADGGKRWIQLLRDSKARYYPNAFCSPGGVWDSLPRSNAIKELNEEIGIVIRTGKGKYHVLFCHDGGDCGISREEKIATLPLMLERMMQRYGGAFHSLTPQQMVILETPLVADTGFAIPAAKVSIHIERDGIAEEATQQGMILYKPSGNAIAFQTHQTLPASVTAPDGEIVPLRDLRHGENVFFADMENIYFNREIYALTAGEIQYALQFPGAVMDNTARLFEQGLLHTAPSSSIRRWTPEGEIHHTLILNPEYGIEKGGPFILAAEKP